MAELKPEPDISPDCENEADRLIQQADYLLQRRYLYRAINALQQSQDYLMWLKHHSPEKTNQWQRRLFELDKLRAQLEVQYAHLKANR